MRIVEKPISIEELKVHSKRMPGNLVKVVVDIKKRIMSVGCELHADGESSLIQSGSSLESLWGISIYPDLKSNEWIEFDSLINLRHSYGNTSKHVEDINVQKRILETVNLLIEK